MGRALVRERLSNGRGRMNEQSTVIDRGQNRKTGKKSWEVAPSGGGERATRAVTGILARRTSRSGHVDRASTHVDPTRRRVNAPPP